MMPRTCTSCTHEDRAGIDSALLSGSTFRTIADHYGLSQTSLKRHKAEHMPSSLVKAQEAQEIARADTLLEQVRTYQNRVDSITAKAEAAGDFRTALGGLREARGYIELLAKLLGELDESPKINIWNNPEFTRVQYVIVEALEPYPEARRAVVGALAEVEDG